MGQISRRQFLQYAAAGAAAAGLGSKNARRLISPAEPVPNEVAGEPTIYATTCRECPAGCGMHVWNREGRAVKAEGSPEHPISRGGLCARGQSSLQGLYDPDRIKTPLRRGDDGKLVPSDWASALAAIAARLAPKRGRVVLLSDLQTGTLDELMRAFCSTIGAAAPLYYEPVNYPALSRAYGVLGHEGVPRFVLDDCRLVVSFAADFLETWVSPVEFTRGFARTRDWKDGGAGRFLYVGPWQSMTAANADEFWQVPPAALPHVAFSLLHEVLQGGHARQDAAGIAELARPYDLAGAAVRAGIAPQKLRRVAELFCQEAPTLALAGPAMADDAASRDAAVAAALLNYAAGRVGQTVRLDRPHALGKAAGRKQVAAAIQSLGPDDVLIVHQANPVYSLGGPKDAALRAGLVVYLGTMADETAHQANWVLPVDSPLESWGDYEPYSGIHCLLQPVTGRLYDTRPAGDVLLDLAARAGKPLARAAGQAPGSFQEWQRQRLGPVLTENKQAERLGFAQAAAPATRAQLQPPAQRAGAAIPPTIQPPASLPAGQAELWVYPSIMLFDGRLANRGWLQEAPDPVSYIVWNSWLDIHPRKALSLGLAAGDVVEVRNDVGVIELPIRLNEEQVEDVVSVGLGQGHTALGRFADGVGASKDRRLKVSPPCAPQFAARAARP
jgi:molybdopterin-containing oxidoreductase family iron-sulfur binding subunit